MEAKTIEAPYSETFSIKVMYITIGLPNNPNIEFSLNNKCIFQRLVFFKFIKWTMFKSKIINKGTDGLEEEAKNWLMWTR